MQNVRASRVRFGVVGFGLALAVVTYLDRVCISQTKADISRDLGLSNTQMGLVFSAFTLAYSLFEVPTGWWGDRIGPRRVLTRVVLWWSIFTAATGAAWSYGSLLVCRFLFGIGEAGAFPNLAKAFRLWLPDDERTWAQGLLWATARWGGAVAPLLVVFAMKYTTWRGVFVAFSLLGLVWTFFFYRWFRDKPSDHPSINAAELALLPDPAQASADHLGTPWKEILRSRALWLLCFQYFCQGFFFYFMVNWLPTYLREARHLSTGGSALFSGLPLAMGGVGCLSGGLVLRATTARFGARRSRRIQGLVAFAAAATFLMLVNGARSGEAAALMVGLAAFSNDLAIAPSWISCIDLGGRFAGTVTGLMNMLAALGGVISPALVGYLYDSTKSFELTFTICAAIYGAGFFMWLFLDPVAPVLAENPTLG